VRLSMTWPAVKRDPLSCVIDGELEREDVEKPLLV
jgi:hypothetical protein